MDKLIEAEFIEECKGRFIGKVRIGEEIEECYISSSSRLDKYVNLVGQKVLLERTQGKKLRTKYKLFAVKRDGGYILLNLNESNEMLEKYMISKGVSCSEISREYIYDNCLKTDFKIGDDYFVEVKTIISEKNKAIFPGEYSKRFERQLLLYTELLKAEKNVELAIMLLNDQTKKIILNVQYKKICQQLINALAVGMRVRVYKASLENGHIIVEEDSSITKEFIEELTTKQRKESEVMDAVCFAESMNNYEDNLEENYKKNNGIFYTDLSLTDKMIKIIKPKKTDIIVDPCCGVGSFVMAAITNGYKNIYGMDRDDKAIEVCKKATESSKLFVMDTLGCSGEAIVKKAGMKAKADIVIGNPPYAPLGDGVAIAAEQSFLNKVNDSGSNLFVAAMYRAFELVKEDGIISYIIPKNFLHVSGYSKLRKWILLNKTILSIIDLGMHFKKVRGEQIIINIKNCKPAGNTKIQLLQLLNGEIVKNTSIQQDFYKDEILLFRSNRDFRIYKKMTSTYATLGDVCEGYVGRGKSRSEKAVVGKEIRKFGYKSLPTPKTGKQILIQNIYSAEAGIIAAFGGNYEASQTVTIFTDGNEETCRYVLGILHSRLCNFFLFKYCYNYSRLTMHTDAKYLNKIPLVKYGQKGTKEIVDTVKKIEKLEYMSDEWYDEVKELDNQVFKLFKMTALDAEFVIDEMQKIQSKRWTKNAE